MWHFRSLPISCSLTPYFCLSKSEYKFKRSKVWWAEKASLHLECALLVALDIVDNEPIKIYQKSQSEKSICKGPESVVVTTPQSNSNYVNVEPKKKENKRSAALQSVFHQLALAYKNVDKKKNGEQEKWKEKIHEIERNVAEKLCVVCIPFCFVARLLCIFASNREMKIVTEKVWANTKKEFSTTFRFFLLGKITKML